MHNFYFLSKFTFFHIILMIFFVKFPVISILLWKMENFIKKIIKILYKKVNFDKKKKLYNKYFFF